MNPIGSLNRFLLKFRKGETQSNFDQLNDSIRIRWIIGIILVVVLVLLFPRGKSLRFADMKVGSISTRRIIAPFTFEIFRTDEEIEQDRKIAAQEIHPIFNHQPETIQDVINQVDIFFADVKNVRRIKSTSNLVRKTLRDTLLKRYPIKILETQSWELLINNKGPLSEKKFDQFQDEIKRTVRDILGVGVLNDEKVRYINPDRRLIVIEENQETLHPFSDFYNLGEAMTKAKEILNQKLLNEGYLVQLGIGVLGYFLRPNLIYDESIHKQRQEDAMARVPLSRGFVYENEKIIDKNERVTPEISRKLESLAIKMHEKGMAEGGLKRILPFIGKVAFVIALLFLLVAYTILEDFEIIQKNKAVFLLSLVIGLVALGAWAIRGLLGHLEGSEYLTPVAVGSILIASIFDTKMGYISAAVMSVLVGGIWGNEYNIMATSFFTGVIGVLFIKRIQNRRQLYQTTLFMIGGYLFMILIMGFIRYIPFQEIVRHWKYGMINGLVTPSISYVLLAIFEPIFDITTDFTLLELSNINHPLLKRLSVEAPGTYHHSILVGNFAEAAAQAVEANALLAKVGSYYHDIGKLEKAEYFVENQFSGVNPHHKLTSRMSALILSNHVKKGVELAVKYRLPASIRDIMLQHHGTSVMSYFYQKAVSENGLGTLSENDYRYQGPRPQSKEAAIVMLADAVEAAARALKDPTHSRLKGLVENLVDERFQEGELDESPLTLRDLERIKENFLKILAATFHTRVEYPDKEETKAVSVKKKEASSGS